jgi:GTP cyclohydrolase I
MPSSGDATVAYVPGSQILGLGTIARLVSAFARRLSLQESIGVQVVQTLMAHGARGAHCRLELSHSCLSARGARQSQARVVTSASAGTLASAEGRSELALAMPGEPRG